MYFALFIQPLYITAPFQYSVTGIKGGYQSLGAISSGVR